VTSVVDPGRKGVPGANGAAELSPPESMGEWLKTSLPELLARRAEAEAHEAICTATPCDSCNRHVCACGALAMLGRRCDACLDLDLANRGIEPTRKSVPTRFQWALSCSVEQVQSRVQGDPDGVRRGILAPPSAGLLFMGPSGSGKTSLAVAMLGAWVKSDTGRRRGSVFVEASVLSRARARFRLGAGEAPLVEQCLSAPLLLLDDLGQEREDRDGCITDVVYGRSNADLPTWVTCGLTTQDQTLEAFAAKLSARYDGGFVRRMIEIGKRVQLGGAK